MQQQRNEGYVTLYARRTEVAALGIATASYLRVIEDTIPASVHGRTEVIHYLNVFQDRCYELLKAMARGQVPEPPAWVMIQASVKEVVVFGTAVEAYMQSAAMIRLPHLPYDSPAVVITHLVAFLQRSMHMSLN